MKQAIICFLLTLMSVSFCACSSGANGTTANISETTIESQPAIDSEEENEVDTHNRKMIAEALGIAEDSRNIRTILSALDTIGAGELQQAQVLEENSERVMDIVAEDGALYRIYLTDSGKVDGVKDKTTGEWVIKSMR